MPKRDWGSDIAIGGLVVITITVCIAIANSYVGKRHQIKDASYTSRNEELSPGGEDIKNRRPAADSSVCRQAQTEKEYELCQAWRAASAAKEAADTAYLQYVVSIGGLLGLILTVFYTARAAQGARRAAEVAERSLGVVERAYLSVEPLGIKQRKAGRPWFGYVGVRNTGHLPAQRMDWFICVRPFIADKDWKPPGYDGMRKGNHVVPSGSLLRFGSPRFEVKLREKGDYWLYIWGEVRYCDGLDSNTRKFTKFCHRYHLEAMVRDGKGGRFVPVEEARDHIHGNDAN